MEIRSPKMMAPPRGTDAWMLIAAESGFRYRSTHPTSPDPGLTISPYSAPKPTALSAAAANLSGVGGDPQTVAEEVREELRRRGILAI